MLLAQATTLTLMASDVAAAAAVVATAAADHIIHSPAAVMKQRARRTTPWVDTTDGVHAFLTFDSGVSPANITAHAKMYDYVWGAHSAHIASYRAGNQDIMLSMYIPYSRDPSCTVVHPPATAEDLVNNSTVRNGNPPPGLPHKNGKPVPTNIKWWLAHHPDWITYKCDRTTIAYEEGDCNVPLDISNPDVIDWQQRFVREAAASGYDAMACDNYQLNKMGGACGIYSGGKWVQKWTGKEHDPRLAKDVIEWMRHFVKLAHTVKAQSGRPMLVLPNSCGIPSDDAVWQLPDAVLNEDGFTRAGHTRAIGEDAFVDLVDYMVKIQQAGKAYYSLNEWGAMANASGLDRAVRQWCVSTYLMGKNQASAVYISTTQGYGHLMPIQDWPELTAPVGKATGPMAKQQGVYLRNFTTGVSIVNPTNVSAAISLDSSYDYTDCYNVTVTTAESYVMLANSGAVLLRSPKQRGSEQPHDCAPQSCGAHTTIRVVSSAGGGGRDATTATTCPSIRAALACIPDRQASAPRITILVAPGIYRNQSLVVQRSKGRVSLAGDHPSARAVVVLGRGSAGACGGANATLPCGALSVEADDFILANITLANAANATTMVPTIPAGKPFAIEVGADRCSIYNSRLLGKDDSVFTGRYRVYFRNTTISGSTDFNFGQGSAVYDQCVLVAQPGRFWSFITAHAGTAAHGNAPRSSYLILDSFLPLVGAQRLGTTFLGRPWGPLASVVFKNTFMDRHIAPAGWTCDKYTCNEMQNVSYAEFNSTGPGANPSKRAAFSKQLTAAEADEWTVERVLQGWVPPKQPLLSA